MLTDSRRQSGRVGRPAPHFPKQVLVVDATEREINTIMTTLSPRQRTEALLTAAHIIRTMFTDPIRHD
jgi:hypothetical protein